MFFELKITNILKSSGWGLEKSGLPWEQNFCSRSRRCVSCFDGLYCKLAKVALFIIERPRARTSPRFFGHFQSAQK